MVKLIVHKVEYIWCKLCFKHKVKIEQSVQLKCKVKEDALAYTNEVRFIKSSCLHKRGKIYQVGTLKGI